MPSQNIMSEFKIKNQIEAEKDSYLIECFHDAGYINKLIDGNYSIIAGRKGSGKTAIARYLEEKAESFDIDIAYRISVRDAFSDENTDRNTILFFVLIQTIKHLLSQDGFINDAKKYWLDFLAQNGVQNVSDYETFIESGKNRKTGFSISSILNYIGIAKVDADATSENITSYTKSDVSNSPSILAEAIKQSMRDDKKVYIFIDDLSDYFDDQDKNNIKKDICLVRDILFQLSEYNFKFVNAGVSLFFVSLLRDDLFEYMEGSNINKLRTDALQLDWDEKSFASLLIARLPFYESDRQEALLNPIESIRKYFPDEIFADTLKKFNTNHYATNFYAYIVAISFNRPRDFLKFCYAMRNRLSTRHIAEFESIESAEIEYTEYFMRELRDELYLASKVLNFNADYTGMNKLIDLLSKENGIKSTQLKMELGRYLGLKTSISNKMIDYFIYQLWWYGVLGFQDSTKGSLLNYRYLSSTIPLTIDKIKEYVYYLHRGLWWFAQKRK